MFNLWNFINSLDSGEMGAPIGEVDLNAKTIKVGTKLDIKPISAAYTVDFEDSGKVLLVDTAVTITLPTPTASAGVNWDGFHVIVYVAADVSVTIATQTTDTLVAFNDVAADSIAFSTSSEKAGNAVHFFCYGTKWYSMVMLAAETATPTIAT